jgi:hypothetical protein
VHPLDKTISASLLGYFVICGLALACLGTCSCKKQSLRLKEQKEGIELSVFITSEMSKYGGSNQLADALTATGITNYAYSEDKDGFQVVCQGNRVAALFNVFGAQFGSPVLAKTNSSGLAAFVYSVQQTGLGVNCGVFTNADKEITHLVVVKPNAL